VISFAPGRYPPPAWTFVRYVPGFLMAGPGAIVRGLRTSSLQDAGHPDDEHHFLWWLAVDPAHQRTGVGRALLNRVFAEADAPVYLDTANPANVPYYASFGFEEIGRAALPRGATLWYMLRAHPAEPGASGL
jgi:GNAT superfamily N-acetyltransferase